MPPRVVQKGVVQPWTRMCLQYGGQRLKVGALGGPPAAQCHTAPVVGCRALAYGRRWVVLRGDFLYPPRLCCLSVCFFRLPDLRLTACDM